MLNPDLTVAVSAARGMRVKLDDLSPRVKKAIPDRAPVAEVAYINKEGWGDHVVYVVTFKDEAHYPRLLLSEDGVVVEEEEPQELQASGGSEEFGERIHVGSAIVPTPFPRAQLIYQNTKTALFPERFSKRDSVT